jgi:hypothetical protein
MRLLLSQADMRVRADLAWLDLVEGEVANRFAASSGASPPATKGR